MIFGNKNNIKEFNYLEENIKKCFEYANNNDLINYDKGSYEIEGKDIFLNIVEYETVTPEERFWEAHRNYLDLHLMLNGKEQIDINFINNMEQKDFVEKDDFLPLEGEKNSNVILNQGDFLICYPSDAHRTAILVDKPCKIKKAIFKIIIK
ncbi:YhcH/YjgK/YiaL family protein [Clostridium hydrogeniformans]|uniref:YhcH/YjgK/YiaL family protein n=1 Tax=Clostridium hydrogeniformans TaxID=349933 RepID=UPI0004834B23|nr:YhcH/YjgK/YiaL family protein [Clostridium hydrogeniformans]